VLGFCAETLFHGLEHLSCWHAFDHAILELLQPACRFCHHRLMIDGAPGRKISEPLLDGLSDIDLVRELLPPCPVRERVDEALGLHAEVGGVTHG